MRIILKGAVFLLSLILCFIIIARIAAAPAKEKPVEDTYNDASSTVSISPIETVLEPSPPDEEPEQVEEEWPYPISQEEIELIALVTMAEAEGETELGQRLVIDTILNRVDDSHFPDNVTDVIFQPNQFTSMWNGRVDRCYVKEELVELVQEELLERTNYECVFFTAGVMKKCIVRFGINHFHFEDDNLTLDVASTSGGFFTEIATEILDNGGKVYGVGYSDGMDVLHMRIDNTADLKVLQKSKYVQSDMRDVYVDIKKDIESGDLVLFVGCPCQVAAIYSFLGKNYANLYTIEFICMGVNSPLA